MAIDRRSNCPCASVALLASLAAPDWYNDSRNQFGDLTQSILAGRRRSLRSRMLCCFLVIVFFSNESTAACWIRRVTMPKKPFPLL